MPPIHSIDILQIFSGAGGCLPSERRELRHASPGLVTSKTIKRLGSSHLVENSAAFIRRKPGVGAECSRSLTAQRPQALRRKMFLKLPPF
jgi:hypothetical protein